MRRSTFAAVLLLAMHAGCAAEPAGCEQLPACVEDLRELAQARSWHSGMGPDARELKQQILAKDGAVDALVPLLRDPDKRVADLAAYMLRDAPAIDAAYLPQIRDGLDRDLGWLAPALARIGTDEAAKEAVDRYLVSDSAPGNQEAYALVLFGRRAIPFILEHASCRVHCTDRTHYLLGSVLGDMGPERSEAGPELLRLASDPDTTPQVARGLLLMIADLGSEGLALEADLLRLRERESHLSRLIDEVLVRIGSSQAGAIFTERLSAKPDLIALRDLAGVGIAGRGAGHAVEEILKQEPGLQVPAAVTLGFIGYGEAVPSLVEALDDPMDPRLAWAAAQALGRLGAAEALPALDRTGELHWYGPVRDAAREAADRIRSRRPAGQSHGEDGNFVADFFSFQRINRGLPECEYLSFERESTETKLYFATARERLERLTYPTEIVGYGAADEEEQVKAGAKIIEVHPGNMVEHREVIEQVPVVGLRVEDGWLVGDNRGEWGGELGFFGDDGRFQLILDDNLEDIHRLGDRIVATVGLAHLASNRGSVMELARGPDDAWQAVTWRVLPGAPVRSVVGPQGLVIALTGGGAVAIRTDGTMQMADCPR